MKNEGERNSNYYIRAYREARKKRNWAEGHRPKLLENGEAILGSYDYIGPDEAYLVLGQETAISEKDRNILINYLRARIIMDIVETAVRERMIRQQEIAADIFLESMRVKDIAFRHGVTVRWVNTIKRKGLAAIEDEILLRSNTIEDLSSVFT